MNNKIEHVEYYRLSEDTGGADQALIGTKYDLKGMSRYALTQGQLIGNWPDGITFFAEGINLEDYLSNARRWPLFSRRVRNALEEMRVEGIQFLPVQVQRMETGEMIEGYSLMNVLTVIEAFHKERSIYLDHHTGPNVLRLVLRRDAIGPTDDIFRVKGNMVPIIVSGRVKKCIEEMNASGFIFKLVEAL